MNPTPSAPANQRPGWRLRILLPPNLAAAAQRDAVVVKVELRSPDAVWMPADRAKFGSGAGLVPGHQKAGAAVKAACGGWAGLAQFRRKVLRDLLRACAGADVFAWIQKPDTPLAWDGENLPGVSELLADPPPPPPRPAPSPAEAVHRDRQPCAAPLLDGSRHFLSIQAQAGPDLPLSPELTEFLRSHHFTWETSNRRWWLREERKVMAFLSSHLADLRSGHGISTTPNFDRNLGRVREVEIRVEAREDGDDFLIETSLSAGKAPVEVLERALAEGRSHVEVEGELLLLPGNLLERLDRARKALGSGQTRVARARQRVRRSEVVAAQEVLEELLPGFRPPQSWSARSEALRNLSRLPAPPLSPALDATLRLYQKIGVAWMLHLHRSGLAGVLADEMGLGKTLQALAFLSCLHREPGGKPSLVVAPAGLVDNWLREARRFTPELRTVRHLGDSRTRDASAFSQGAVVVTAYTTLSRDEELLGSVDWRVVIGDEAQHVKNRRTQGARALASLRSEGRLLLTGTPIENSLDDLLSLFAFLMPGFLGSAPADLPPAEKAAWNSSRLKRAAPFILRRTKRGVAPELPEKIEQRITCSLGAAERAAYENLRRTCEQDLDRLAGQGASESAVRLAALTHLLRLRQFCCDPRLLPAGLATAGLASAKLEAFQELLDEALDGGHRLLVFSQFTAQLDLLQDHLTEAGHAFLRIDGSTRDRVSVCERFNNDPGIPLLLISLKAGGTGLNLTGADTVVHYDPWWNPAVEAQATDRAHRIGQTRKVTSLKLVVEDSVEEKVLLMQDAKRRLLEDLLEGAPAAESLGLDELRTLLGA